MNTNNPPVSSTRLGYAKRVIVTDDGKKVGSGNGFDLYLNTASGEVFKHPKGNS